MTKSKISYKFLRMTGLVIAVFCSVITTSFANDEPISFIREAVKSKKTGARAFLVGKTLKEVNIKALVDEAVNNNLDIKISDIDLSKANSYVRQTDAAFNSTLNASWHYSRSETMLRVETVGRIRADKSSSENTENFVLGCVFVDGEPVNKDLNDSATECFRDPFYTIAAETASSATAPSNVPNTYTATLSAFKPFEVGASASASISSKRNIKNSYAISGLRGAMSSTDPFGWGSRMPWTTNASLSLASPLPFTKGFGEYGSSASLSQILSKSSKISALASKKYIRNSVLEQTLFTYWGLVKNYEDLKSIIAHRKIMEKRDAKMKRMLDIGRVRAYEVEQVSSELENLKGREEIAWNNYISSSDTLLNLLNAGTDTVLVPVAFDAKLNESISIDAEKIKENAITNNPELKMNAETLASSKANVRYRKNQSLPDLSFSVSYTASQTDAVFGYKSWDSSLKEISHPDSNDIYVGFQYKLPFWKRAEKAALSRARISERQASDNLQQTKNNIVKRADDAISQANSTETLILQTAEDLKLAKIAYDKALRLRDVNMATEFEVLNRFSDVLSARLANIEAKIGYRKANIQLLSVQGILDETYEGLGLLNSSEVIKTEKVVTAPKDEKIENAKNDKSKGDRS